MGLEASAVHEEVGTNPIAGTFTLSYRGARTALLPFDASATFIQRELSSLRAIDFDITVQKLAALSNKQQWVVTFEGIRGFLK